MYQPEQVHRVQEFLESLPGYPVLADSNWGLLTLADMYQAGNDLETIASSVPFRGGPCSRSIRCCGVCTRQCTMRCVQDCLHRLHIWSQMVATAKAEGEEAYMRVPLAIRLIVKKKFSCHAQLSDNVGEILSKHTNAQLRRFMENAHMRSEENPYKMDYSPQVLLDETTGNRAVNSDTGELQFAQWPDTGLCPYCLPNVLVDNRFGKRSR